ncbi:MAG TPA: hypothetical protein VL633_10520 [Bacteroidota bacterium]|nr:hypothetical protein [Bacteroidota bacterium]
MHFLQILLRRPGENDIAARFLEQVSCGDAGDPTPHDNDVGPEVS